MAPSDDPARVERRLYRQLRDTCEQHRLISPGDRVLVAVSGGKDSHVLLHLFRTLQRALGAKAPSLVAVHLDQRQPGYDGAALASYLVASGVEHAILSEDTYAVVKAKLGEGETQCSLCSRLRRGILYTAAERLGCNKIALGHHRDDGLETFLLNLIYAGKLQAMPARYTTDDGKLEVIRPLIGCAERDIALVASHHGFPIVPCNLCGSQEGLRREKMGELIASLERESPNVRAVMASALGNVKPTHLLDERVREAWLAHPASRGPETPRVTQRRFAAEPTVVRLPLLPDTDRE